VWELYTFHVLQEKTLAEAQLVDALLIAERALLYAINFDVREVMLTHPLLRYLDALGVRPLNGKAAATGPSSRPTSPWHAAPLNSLEPETSSHLCSLAARFAADTWVPEPGCGNFSA
jgi:hypothetical protein